jgi:hypothetical protein
MTGLLNSFETSSLWAAAGRATFRVQRGQTDTQQLFTWLIIAAVIIGVVAGVSVVATRMAHRRRTNSHLGLFAGLCQHHKLSRGHRKLLWAMAQAYRLKYAARVFLDPTLFEPKRLPPALRARKNELQFLQKQLFSMQEEPTRARGAR